MFSFFSEIGIGDSTVIKAVSAAFGAFTTIPIRTIIIENGVGSRRGEDVVDIFEHKISQFFNLPFFPIMQREWHPFFEENNGGIGINMHGMCEVLIGRSIHFSKEQVKML